MTKTPRNRIACALMKQRSGVDAALLEEAGAALKAIRVPTQPMFRAADHGYANRADATINMSCTKRTT